MCEYAAQGNVERIRLLAINGVDVSLGDYDLRTPLHLAACNGNTAVLEYLLKQDSVIVNAVDRFGGTPHQGVKDCFCTYVPFGILWGCCWLVLNSFVSILLQMHFDTGEREQQRC